MAFNIVMILCRCNNSASEVKNKQQVLILAGMWQAPMSRQKEKISLMSKEVTRAIYDIVEMYIMVVKTRENLVHFAH